MWMMTFLFLFRRDLFTGTTLTGTFVSFYPIILNILLLFESLAKTYPAGNMFLALDEFEYHRRLQFSAIVTSECLAPKFNEAFLQCVIRGAR